MSRNLIAAICVLVAIVSLFLSLEYGPTNTSAIVELFSIPSSWPHLDSNQLVVWHLRFPRSIAAAICGACLAGAGVLSQGLFRNPLAAPSIIGASGGAAAFTALLFLMGWAHATFWSLPIAGVAGAMFSTALLLALAGKVTRTGYGLLLTGFALNTLFAALTTLAVSLLIDDFERSRLLTSWLLGSFNGKSWDLFLLALPLAICGILLGWTLAIQLDVLSLGEDTATTLGMRLPKFRIASVLCISLLVGASVSLSGALPFVGLVVPHITRMLFGPNHRRLFLLSMVNGVSLVLLADLVGRTLLAPQELQVGVMTSLIGAPFFILLILRKHGSREGMQ